MFLVVSIAIHNHERMSRQAGGVVTPNHERCSVSLPAPIRGPPTPRTHRLRRRPSRTAAGPPAPVRSISGSRTRSPPRELGCRGRIIAPSTAIKSATVTSRPAPSSRAADALCCRSRSIGTATRFDIRAAPSEGTQPCRLVAMSLHAQPHTDTDPALYRTFGRLYMRISDRSAGQIRTAADSSLVGVSAPPHHQARCGERSSALRLQSVANSFEAPNGLISPALGMRQRSGPTSYRRNSETTPLQSHLEPSCSRSGRVVRSLRIVYARLCRGAARDQGICV
jgi:hypothetical protein